MSTIVLKDGVYEGPVMAGVNAARTVEGSIHDDATASKLGFRGGTVAGSVHMNQFVPVLLEAFGEEWLRTGNLSLYFVTATTDGEPVKAFVQAPDGPEHQVKVWMERESDGARVAEGSAGLGDASQSELRTRDLRGTDPAQLRMLKGIAPGTDMGTHKVPAVGENQAKRIAANEINGALECYSDPKQFGGLVAAPQTMVQVLYSTPVQGLRPAGGAVGLFGAIEIQNVNGPLLLDETYEVTAQVVDVGQSPKTEYLWFDSSAKNGRGDEVARMRMLLRFMKASSPLYAE